MSNESLNDFYNQNRMNKKLRERIDSYEPELSDSLWDRIEHDLVKKENRGKRVVWMVYVMAGLLMLSGVGIYYLANENKKLADAVKESTENLPVYTMPETKVEMEAEPKSEAPVLAGNEENQVSNPPENPTLQTPEVRRNYSPSNSLWDAEEPEEMAEEGFENTELPELLAQENLAATPQEPVTGMLLGNKTIAGFDVQAKKPVATTLDHRKGKEIIPARVQPFIGISSEVGSNRQLVSGPSAARFNHEHSYMFQSHGLELGVQFRNGFFIQSGIRSTVSGSNLWFDYAEATQLDTIPVGNLSDSLVVGDRHAVNEQYWIEIPMQLGYMYRLNSHWSITGQAGMSYSIINQYNGYEPTESFQRLEAAGSTIAQPFKNYWSLTGGAGVSYKIGRNWMLDLQGQYRRGLQNFSASDLNKYPNRKNEMLSGKLGIRYILR